MFKKKTSKNGERIKQRDLVLISKRKKRLQKINIWGKNYESPNLLLSFRET